MLTNKLLLAFGLLATASAMCPNSCSGRGKCGQFDVCECHQNFQGADCSLRTCPFELAWVDVATDDNDAHYYAECANKGICDRKSGECKCFDGYEGKGCRRSTCPEACSGHGTCEYIDQMIEEVEHKRSKNYNRGLKIASDFKELDGDSRNLVTGNTYDLWDHQKIQGCVCDANWEGPDCSARTCPRGDDPLTAQINGNSYSTFVMRQILILDEGTVVGLAGEFDLTFYDLYGGKWTTQEIVVSATDDETAANIQTALRALPNRVVEGVQVYPMNDAPVKFGSAVTLKTKDRKTITAVDAAYIATCTATLTTRQCFIVEFADEPGTSGMQYLLEGDLSDKNGGNGFQPASAGLTVGNTIEIYEWLDSNDPVVETGLATGYNSGDTTEASVCADRGLCNSATGDCECFSGYQGAACQEQEALT